MKYSKTTLFLPLLPQETSITQLKQLVLDALAKSGQPVDEQLSHSFADASVDDLEIYDQIHTSVEGDEPITQYVPLAASQRSGTQTKGKQSAADGSLKLDALDLKDCSAVYVGFRPSSEGGWRTSAVLTVDAVALPVVQIPRFDDEQVDDEAEGA